MKTVSVIIPCYRDSATLARAVDSVLSQSYPAIEVVVVNDCSPESDAIESILRSYPQVRYVRNLENKGLAATRNAGIRAATGEVVAFLDADDEYHPDKIKLQMQFLEPGVAITCDVLNVYPDGRRRPAKKRSRCELIIERPSEILFRNSLNGAGLLIERDLLLRHGLFEESLRSCEDFDLWLRLLCAGVKVKVLCIPLYYYYWNPNGLSKNFQNISKYEMEAIKRYFARIGRERSSSLIFASVVATWILRQLVRSELAGDGVLREQAIINMNMLSEYPVVSLLLKLTARMRLMYLASFFIRLSSFFARKNGLFR